MVCLYELNLPLCPEDILQLTRLFCFSLQYLSQMHEIPNLITSSLITRITMHL
jgi:hypothetical protein